MTTKFNTGQLVNYVDSSLRNKLANAAAFVVVRTKAAISRSKSGRMRLSRAASKFYVASAPGEAPASPTGAVLNTIHYEVKSDGKGNVEARVGPGKKLAGIVKSLMVGARNRAPRPMHDKEIFTNRVAIKAIIKKSR